MNKKISGIEQMNSYLKSIMDIMRRDKAKGPMEYIPELTWMMFVRLLDEKETNNLEKSTVTGDDFQESLTYPYRWQDYAWKDIGEIYVLDNKVEVTNGKKTEKKDVFETVGINKKDIQDLFYDSSIVLDGKATRSYFKVDFKENKIYIDNKTKVEKLLAFASTENTSIFGDKRIELLDNGINLIDFINGDFIPYIKKFKENPKASTKQKLIALIFDHIEKTKISAETNLLDIFEKIHHICDGKVSGENFFAMSQIYESLLLKMGDKNSDGGQFFTPRSVIKTMITAINPEVKKTFYDPCCGTGGFLAETYKFLYENKSPDINDLKWLSEDAFWGKDNSDTVFAITLANLAVHNISMPHISNENTLTGQITYAGLFANEPVQYDYIFTNPPFGGKENVDLIKGTGFAYKTSNTQILFIQHVIEKLKKGGECAIVLDEGVLFRTNEIAFSKTKEKLLSECDLHTIVSLPGGVFTSTGAGVKTNLLFFKKGKKTEKIWYYDMSGLKVNKGNPLTFDKFSEFLELYKTKAETKNSWFVSYKEIEAKNFDLKAVNPNIVADIIRDPREVVDEIIEGVEKIKGWMSEVKSSLDNK